jgi:BirA family biotin operon repressor/biotin-[acetyl-CoA-carboxylase] ligase
LVTEGAGPYAWVERELANSAFRSIRYVEETESTNTDAAALLGDDRYGGHTIVAEYQRSGAARKGRSWQAAAGSALLFSTILPRAISTQQLWIVPFWVALAVRAGMRACGIETTLQWPNDLLLHDRKIAGVLCQSSVTGHAASVVCGVGINVRRWLDAQWIEPPPAFCDEVANVDRAALLNSILREYDGTLSRLERPERIVALWNAAAQLPGRRYRIRRDDDAESFEAIAQGLAEGGALRVVRNGGDEETVSLADARVLR